MMEITYNIEELPKIAQKIIEVSSSKTLLFYGEMGAGKTTLIKELVKQLGSSDRVSSPTFSLVNEYLINNSYIYHFDFHRINHEEEAYDIGFEEYLDNNNWIFIEWPEKIKNLLPQNKTTISIIKKSDKTRKISISTQKQNVKTKTHS
ncbi:tRNA threonylcarbamoyladenosine biosynthesis protein TsaE [Mesonia oceanica]|uniref:tRNA threonylcarbamoyladenosine biosynthesis protein TsaE n=1 Tax=Mesonia oceanica TaxID=2687242 RepID=A0AC61YCI6_9FLAO|nr:tRNA threonylcarbamoyladenosine biosynthesis protein TsaE [Mesonia oceanica]|tara:strand:- start:31112 stop:31555 length:444 start_codon:yes stop_codon:yes gene_type:complete